MSQITTLEQLTALYPSPHPFTLSKAVPELEPHSITFIEHCPFIMISSVDENGFIDTSPRGGEAGFVKILDAQTIAFPDSPGNNRLDTLRNILARPQIGILLTIPGIEDIVRIKGTATLHRDQTLLDLCLDNKKAAKLVVKVKIEETFFHCPKAIKKAKLWEQSSHVERDFLPPLLQLIKEQKSFFSEMK